MAVQLNLYVLDRDLWDEDLIEEYENEDREETDTLPQCRRCFDSGCNYCLMCSY